ncbi:hypothetical protein CTAYLR_008770 [Chrysophaeum taylorii]|uniref:40S ribosomal protein S6 n=1 Tax=Chrysophaeum taylorii TaxID=2483200 RepID=A0AAD7XLI1_9STRA|nr:hypothetical protein CTAYLR_008770 [Chrysophaeum taylorii]
MVLAAAAGPLTVETKRIVARCGSARPSAEARGLALENKSVVIRVQTSTGTRNNLCEGQRSDWREGLGQCLHALSGVRVLAHNSDGSCADCGRLERVDGRLCRESEPWLIVVLGGGESANKSTRYACSGTYCRRTGNPVRLEQEDFPPPDYMGACDVHAFDATGRHLFAKSLGKTTRVAWFPILSPNAEMRVLWEASTLYASRVSELPKLRKRNPRLRRPRSDDVESDYAYLKRVVEPAFDQSNGRARIDVIRDDAIAKPLLLPPKERSLFDATDVLAPREPRLIYVGQFRYSKGQVAFLRKLDEASLGPFTLELRGSRPKDADDAWDDIYDEIRRFQRVRISNSRVSHESMMRDLATASGLIHYSSGDRNPRVLYEALYFGLPLFVSIQSMPYVALQCQSFVALTDVDRDAATMNAELKAWVDGLTLNERRKDKVRRGTRNATTYQAAILAYVRDHLTPARVYHNLCERFGLCEPSGRYVDVKIPWLLLRTSDSPSSSSDSSSSFRDECAARRRLWRFENWVRTPWNESRVARHGLNISTDPACRLETSRRNCRQPCLAQNRRDRKRGEAPAPCSLIVVMKLNIACPQTGGQKMIEIDDEKKLRALYDKRISQEVDGASLGDEFNGYVFRISGGNDKQGFPMKQGVLCNHRVRLLLRKGHSCYRQRRAGERKRKSVRGCVVGSDLAVLNLVVVKIGETAIEGLTDVQVPVRLGPKRANKIRKLFALSKDDDPRKYVIARKFENKKGKTVTKAPKIQRLVTPLRLQRKRHRKAIKMKAIEKAKKEANEYNRIKTQRIQEQKDARRSAISKRRSSRRSALKAQAQDED